MADPFQRAVEHRSPLRRVEADVLGRNLPCIAHARIEPRFVPVAVMRRLRRSAQAVRGMDAYRQGHFADSLDMQTRIGLDSEACRERATSAEVGQQNGNGFGGGHHRNWSCFRLLPRAFSTGYRAALATIFSWAAATGSMPRTVDSWTR